MLEILTAIGGTAVVIVGLSNWLGKVWATRIASEESQKFQLEFDAIKREKDHLFDTLKTASFRYSDSQFGLYNELWRSLVDLKSSGDSLWEQVSSKKVKEFAGQVKETSDAIERSALLIVIIGDRPRFIFIIGDRLNLPQFNGYFKSATMSPKEYPYEYQKKAI